MKSPAFRIAALALALAAGSALAQGYGYGPGFGPGMRGGFGPGGGYGGQLARLDLTDEQRDRIATLQEEHRRANWDRMSEMRAEQLRLRSLYRSDKSDANAIAEQQKKVDGLRRQMFDSHIAARGEIDAVLTPEQRKQLGR